MTRQSLVITADLAKNTGRWRSKLIRAQRREAKQAGGENRVRLLHNVCR